MGLLDDLKPTQRQFPCKVRDVAASLEQADKDILLEAVMNEDWKYYTLEQVLLKKGLRISQGAIKHHRIKACPCWKI